MQICEHDTSDKLNTCVIKKGTNKHTRSSHEKTSWPKGISFSFHLDEAIVSLMVLNRIDADLIR